MSYAWRIAGDALADLRQLEPWLQEDVLDEIERMSESPWLLRADADGCAVHELDRVAAGTWHIVFLRLHRDEEHEVLSVLGIAGHTRPHSPPEGE